MTSFCCIDSLWVGVLSFSLWGGGFDVHFVMFLVGQISILDLRVLCLFFVVHWQVCDEFAQLIDEFVVNLFGCFSQ